MVEIWPNLCERIGKWSQIWDPTWKAVKVDSNWNLLLWRFDKAFKNFKNNMQFVGQLMEWACELAWDDNVKEENIKRFEQ